MKSEKEKRLLNRLIKNVLFQMMLYFGLIYSAIFFSFALIILDFAYIFVTGVFFWIFSAFYFYVIDYKAETLEE